MLNNKTMFTINPNAGRESAGISVPCTTCLFRASAPMRDTFLSCDLEEIIVLLELFDDPFDECVTILGSCEAVRAVSEFRLHFECVKNFFDAVNVMGVDYCLPCKSPVDYSD